MKPNVKVYDTFSEFVESKKSQAKEAIADARVSLKRNWYQPENNQESSSLDVAELGKKFPRDDCQQAYAEFLKGNGIPIDATAIKFQNGYIAGAEQAFRLRHCSLPRSLAAGYMEDVRWSNEMIPFLLLNHIKVIADLAHMDYEAKEIDKND